MASKKIRTAKNPRSAPATSEPAAHAELDDEEDDDVAHAKPNPSAASPKATAPKPFSLVAIAAQLVVVSLAAALVYGFVTVSKEGELRHSCAPTCLLKPDYQANIASSEDEAHAPRMAPDFSLQDMNGKTVSLSSYRGKVVILNFWMKSCPPCLEEFPDLVELAHVLAPRTDVAMLAVSIDEGPDSVRDTLKAVVREDLPFPILFDPEAKIVAEKYGTKQFPETWIIDKEGRIRARFDGPRNWTQGTVTEFIDQIRTSDFCPMEIKMGKRSGQAQKQNICLQVSGG